MIKGAIFDIDGTLLDSMPVWENAGARYLATLGIEARSDLKERLDACLLVISDKKKKGIILTAMKKAFGNTKAQENETVKHK